MFTVAQPQTPCKAFYGILDEAHGVLGKVEGAILFLADDGTLTVIEPEHVPFLAVLGEVGLCEAARTMDRLHGGAARIACTRAQEVA